MNFSRYAFIGSLLAAVAVEALAAPPLRSHKSLPVPPMFEENQGQYPASTKFLARSHGFRTSFGSGGAEIRATDAQPVRLSFPSQAAPRGVDRMATKLNYFHGNDPSKWVRGASAYRKVAYENPDGPGLLFYWDPSGNLEFDLTLRPGETADSAAFRLEGQTGLSISATGDLTIQAGPAVLTLRKPSVYQVLAGMRRKVPCDYILGEDGKVGFHLGAHDDRLAVTIDPTLVITTATYLGGSTGSDDGRAVAVDSSGNIYIAGDTSSTDFPLTAPYQSTFTGTDDAFIAELNPSGSQVLFATFLGGSTSQIADGIGIDSAGNIYVAGYTRSTDFPTKNAAFSTMPDVGGLSGWVAKFNNTGSTLLYSTFLGGSGEDLIDALAVDSAGNAYVTGGTFSHDFPIVNGYEPNGFGTSSPGFDQSFLTKFSTSGTILYSTISTAFGGDGKAVACDNNGIAVFTSDVRGSAPTVNAYLSQSGGGQETYIVKVDTKQTGSNSLLFATFLGGSDPQQQGQPLGIALDSSDNVYVAGTPGTSSFPLMNAYSVTPSAGFLSKLSSSGSSLMFSTYFNANPQALATDTSGNVYMTGASFTGFPQVNALANQSGYAFVTAFSFSGTVIYSTYVGAGVAGSNGIATSGGGNVTIVGQAAQGVPVTPNAVQPTPQSGNAFVVTLTYAQPAVLTTTSVTPTAGGNAGLTTVAVSGSDILTGATLSLQLGGTTITAFTSTVAADSRSIGGTFDLRNQPTGSYNVVVTNPDTTTSTLPGAFSVSLGGAPQLSVNVLGSAQGNAGDGTAGLVVFNVLFGGARTETVIVSNNGTTDAFAVPVTAMIQSGVNVTLQNTLVTPAQNPGAPVIDYSQIPAVFTYNGSTYVPLVIPWIPAGGSSYFRLTFTAPTSTANGTAITQNITLGNPYLMIDPNGTPFTASLRRSSRGRGADGVHADITAASLAAELVTTPQGRLCLKSIAQALLAALPGGPCDNALLNALMGQFAAAAGGAATAAANGGVTADDVQAAAVQGNLAAIQTLLQCAGSLTPIGNFVNACQAVAATTSAINDCTKFLVQIIVEIRASTDPNAKDGPTGAGSPLWISGTIPAPYTIEFENLPTASAPAGQVVITDQINPQLFNLSSFSFGAISFGSTTLTPTPGSNSYSTMVDLQPAQNTIVSVNASLDNDGLITWTFQSLDPSTGAPIQDPSQGFLPPNVTAPQGQGTVSFTVQLKQGLATGTAIPNQANVVFDFNAPILTNVWQNTIDTTPPVSMVSSLTPNQSSNTFNVNWAGTDVGSGVQNFTIFNSVNGGPFTPWISNTMATSGSCVAAPNSTQAFFAIATDLAGNVEMGKTVAEATTQAANVDEFVITTSPPGLLVSVDGQTAQASPLNPTWTIGTQHTIATTSPQTLSSMQYTWANWSDAGTISHIVTANASVLTYTATFNTGSPTLQSIAVTPTSPSIAKGATQQFTATGTYSDSSTANITNTVTWNSATLANATISSTGLATGVGVGTSNITASMSSITSPAAVLTVTAATLQSIAVTPTSPSIAKGATQQFTATGTYSDSSTQNITNTVTWNSATLATATISSTGLATGVGVGTSNITASMSSITSPAAVLTVTAATLQSIAVTPTSPSIAKGATQQFTATGTYSDSSTQNITNTVTWNSATLANATISSTGLATGVGVGTSNITASMSSITSPAAVLTVTAATLQSIAVTPTSPSIAKGATQQFTATGTYSDSSTQNITNTVTWNSATLANATISSTGLATGVGVGTSNITASMSSITSPAAVLTVTAATLQSIAVAPTSPSIAKGATQQFTATGTYSDSSTQNITNTVTWNSATLANATISSTGLATGVGVGTSNITASMSSITSPAAVLTVTAATLQSIAVTPTSPSIAKGATQQFTATGTYSDSSTANITSTVTWNSATLANATISSTGLATGVGVGTSNITASMSSITSPAAVLTVTAATLQSIAVTPTSPSIAKGATQQFTATGTYSDSSTQNITNTVTWNSATLANATISSTGLATGVGVGTSNITASMSSITSPAAVLTVTAATLQSIAVTPTSPSIAKGATQQFTATGTYSDSSTQNITNTVTWNSATLANATISSTGLATGVGVGTSNITASMSSITSPAAVLTVTAATLQSIAVTPTSPSITKGATQQFTATGTYSDSSTQNITNTVTWNSATLANATISSTGLATGVGVGTSNITASMSSITSPAAVLTVTAATLQSIAVTPTSPSIAKGATQQFTATGTYSDSSTQNITNTVTWNSATLANATISSTGLATGVGVGTSNITASMSSITSPAAVLTVTAATLQSIAVTPTSPSIAKGATQQFTATGTYSDSSTANITNTVTWNSATLANATISSTGLATGVGVGTSNITASMSSITSPAAVLTVTAATLQSIAVTPTSPSIAKGATQQFIATGTYSDSSTQNITNTVTWNSATLANATISSTGLATGVGVGTSNITASMSSSTSPAAVLTVTAVVDVAPVVTNVSSTTPNGTYGVNSTIAIDITFSKAVTVTGTPLLALNDGGIATYASGSGNAILTFSYTPLSGQSTSLLDAVSTTALTLNGGTIVDAASTPAVLTLPAPGSAGSLSANDSIAINTTAPTVVSYSVLFGTESYNVIGTSRNRLPWQITGITVVFSKPIGAGSAASLGGLTATGFSGLGTNTLTWTFAGTADGAYATTLAGSGTNAITDVAGNDLAGGAGFAQSLKILWGDVNDDSVVNVQDEILVNNGRSQAYNIFLDLNGDGVVNTTDVAIASSQIGHTLP